MRITVRQSEIYMYQKEAVLQMKLLEDTYMTLADRVKGRISLLSKCKVMFKWPPSLRMASNYEYVASPITKFGMKKYRTFWHDYWSVLNLFPECENGEDNVILDEYETEVILSLRKYSDKKLSGVLIR